MNSSSPFSAAMPGVSSDMYTDLNSLQHIKQMGRGDNADKQQALEEVAKQFESVFLNMMMKSMREANEAFQDESMRSNEMDFYQQMFDQQLTLTLSKGGVGLADALVRQLQRQIPGLDSTQSQELKADSINPFDVNALIEKYDPSKFSAADLKASLPDSAGSQERIESLQEFKEKLFPLAEKAAKELGVDPRFLLSQAALETGWGKHMIEKSNGDNSFNLFGIKANHGWNGDVATVKTLEYENGIPKQQQARFRAYSSYEQSFSDYVDFIKSQNRYQQALQSADDEGYVRELQKAGYATDPNYADKIIGIVQRNFESESTDGNKLAASMTDGGQS